MPAELLKGMSIANKIREEIITSIKNLGVEPKMAVILAGDDEASVVYAQSKAKIGSVFIILCKRPNK